MATVVPVRALLAASRKPGVIIAPIWKTFCKNENISERDLFMNLAKYTNAPVATAFVSNNIYICPPGDALVARLTASLMFHGEVGLDAIYGLSEISDLTTHDRHTIDLLSRKVKLFLTDGSTEKVGAASDKLLKHGRKFSSLLNCECEDLGDHAWLACAFSFARHENQVSSGAAAEKPDGSIFRAGEIESVISAKDAAIVGMRANGREAEADDEWVFCDERNFRDHRWYPEFEKLANRK